MSNERQRDPKESPALAQDRQAHGRRIIESIFGKPTPAQSIRYPLEWCEDENQGMCGTVGDCLYQCGQPD